MADIFTLLIDNVELRLKTVEEDITFSSEMLDDQTAFHWRNSRYHFLIFKFHGYLFVLAVVPMNACFIGFSFYLVEGFDVNDANFKNFYQLGKGFKNIGGVERNSTSVYTQLFNNNEINFSLVLKLKESAFPTPIREN